MRRPHSHRREVGGVSFDELLRHMADFSRYMQIEQTITLRADEIGLANLAVEQTGCSPRTLDGLWANRSQTARNE
jgi:hypothetical protein